MLVEMQEEGREGVLLIFDGIQRMKQGLNEVIDSPSAYRGKCYERFGAITDKHYRREGRDLSGYVEKETATHEQSEAIAAKLQGLQGLATSINDAVW